MRTGCLFIGARHVQVVPGGYQIVKLSRYARELFEHLSIAKGPGDYLTDAEVDAVTTFYVTLLETAYNGRLEPFQSMIGKTLEQVRFHMPAESGDMAVTFSGGVGELVYRSLQGHSWPATTHFGDLGIDLARRILQSSIWADSLRSFRPMTAGRATVYGLLRHSTEVSGNTLFLAPQGSCRWPTCPSLAACGEIPPNRMFEMF